jgi:hypothetical protein
MTEADKDAKVSATIYGRVTWGAYDPIFSVNPTDTPKFDCHDNHQTVVEVGSFDPGKYDTPHPVKLTCTATGRFALTRQLDEAFSLLAVGRLPKGSRNEADVRSHSPYSIPMDLYPPYIQAFMSETYRALSECATRVWRLLRWRSGAIGSHTHFQTILASEWSVDGQAPWHPLPVKGYARTSNWAVPRLDASVTESVQQLLSNGTVEPTSEELLREAWAVHAANPRAGLLLAIAAAEVGFKELVIDLVPNVRWLTLNVPSPPLLGLLKNSLPELPVRQGIAAPAPQELRKVMQRAVEARNALAHQGGFDSLDVDLYEVIDVVRSLLRQFAHYRGFVWVAPVW